MAEGWHQITVGEIADVFDGPHATPQKTNSGPVFLGISNLENGRLNLDQTEHVSEDDYRQWTRRVTPKADDIVFSYETRLGEAAIVPHGLRCCLGRRMGLLRAKRDRIVPRFLLYVYLGPAFQKVIRARTIHGSTVDRIALIEFPSFTMRIPPLYEQRGIAAVLGALDDKIDLNRRLKQSIEETSRTLFESWFVEFDPVRAKAEGRQSFGMAPAMAALFPDGFEWSKTGEVPRKWPLTPIGDHFVLQRGTTYEGRLVGLPGPALLGLGSIEPGGGFREGHYRTYGGECPPKLMLIPGDLFVALKGATKDGSMVGSIARVPPTVSSGRLTQDTVKLDFKQHQEGLSEYLYWLLRTPAYRDYCAARVTGSAQVGLSRDDFLAYTAPLPSPAVLALFGKFETALARRQYAADAESRSLAELRDYLLPKLLSGEIRVRDAEKLAGAAL